MTTPDKPKVNLDVGGSVRWWLVIVIVAIVLVPLVGVILYMLRRNKIADEATLRKSKMRISAAVEDVDWGIENDGKSSDRKGKGGDLVVPFDQIEVE